jgi:peroxiredoxin Q/BCP
MLSHLLSIVLLAAVSHTSYGKSDFIGKPAPLFELKNQDGVPVKLADRKGKGFTVLFFYPKAGTPGCTKQACAFRDSIKVIRDKNAEVFGISADDVAAQKKFHDEHKMTFDLLSDSAGKVIGEFRVKMPMVTWAKRQTFVLDKDLIIREHFEDVDPALDAKNVADAIEKLNKPVK